MTGVKTTIGVLLLLASARCAVAQEPTIADLPRALQIVHGRRVAEYPQAVRVLRHVSRLRDPRAADARAQLDWLESDLKVRLANIAWMRGDGERSLLLLRSALQHRVLGPEARQALRAQHDDRLRRILAGQCRPEPVPPELSHQVTAVSGHVVQRAQAFGFSDVAARGHYVWYRDPIALRRARSFPDDPAPAGPTLLDALEAVGAPRPPAPGALALAAPAPLAPVVAAVPGSGPAPAHVPVRGLSGALGAAFGN